MGEGESGGRVGEGREREERNRGRERESERMLHQNGDRSIHDSVVGD